MVNYSKLSKGAILVSLPFVLPFVPVKTVTTPAVHSAQSAKPSNASTPKQKLAPAIPREQKRSERVAAALEAAAVERGICTCHKASELYKKGEYVKAAQLYSKAGGLMAKEYGPKSNEVALMRYNEGCCYSKLSQFRVANGLYNESVAMFSANGVAKNREEIARGYWGVGTSAAGLKSYKQAIVAFDQAVSNYKVLGPSSDYGECLKDFADCYKRTGNNAKAKLLMQQAKTMTKEA